ncbi:MAG: hypothetical protein R2568_05080 [Candidatus Scalindua sp.]|jgi:hypothetical protein|nr:hypothetical protein [Candidatus Scalindua sp.]MDV5166103.1 hypothetical protein [Candidatus Scalindua sp.]
MLNRFTKNLKCIVENSYLNLAIGLLLLYTGISETVYELKNVSTFRIGMHHGIIIFAILSILKILPHFTESMEHIEKIGDKKK